LVAVGADEQPAIVVRGPTIVAFFEPATDAKLAEDANTNEALSDFQLYAAQARVAFRHSGIDFQEISAKSFKIRVGARTTTFHAGKITVGYYFVAPGKKPRVEYGVRTDRDLLEISKAYFGKAVK
jgi:hypothetical protein